MNKSDRKTMSVPTKPQHKHKSNDDEEGSEGSSSTGVDAGREAFEAYLKSLYSGSQVAVASQSPYHHPDNVNYFKDMDDNPIGIIDHDGVKLSKEARAMLTSHQLKELPRYYAEVIRDGLMVKAKHITLKATQSTKRQEAESQPGNDQQIDEDLGIQGPKNTRK